MLWTVTKWDSICRFFTTGKNGSLLLSFCLKNFKSFCSNNCSFMLSEDVTHKLLNYLQTRHMLKGAAQDHTRALWPTLRFSKAVWLMCIWPRAKDSAEILQGSVRKIHATERWEMTVLPQASHHMTERWIRY